MILSDTPEITIKSKAPLRTILYSLFYFVKNV